MTMRKTTTILTAALLAAVIVTAGCVARPLPPGWRIDTGLGHESSSSQVTDGTSHEQVIGLQGAAEANVSLSMGAGEFNVRSSDSSALAEATFYYNDPMFAPTVDYSVEGTAGTLAIEQGEVRFKFGSTGPNTWDVRLGKGIPLDLTTHLGAGTADVDLSEIDVRKLVMRLGAGETSVDLTGPRASSVNGDIQAGVGQLTIKLPSDVGVKVTGRQEGVGSFEADGFKVQGDAYVNDAYGTSPVTIDLTVVRGVGEVKLELE